MSDTNLQNGFAAVMDALLDALGDPENGGEGFDANTEEVLEKTYAYIFDPDEHVSFVGDKASVIEAINKLKLFVDNNRNHEDLLKVAYKDVNEEVLAQIEENQMSGGRRRRRRTVRRRKGAKRARKTRAKGKNRRSKRRHH